LAWQDLQDSCAVFFTQFLRQPLTAAHFLHGPCDRLPPQGGLQWRIGRHERCNEAARRLAMHSGNTIRRLESHPLEAPGHSALAEERPINIPHEGGLLIGSLAIPLSPRGVVLIASDASGDGRASPLRALARQLRSEGLGTLIVKVVDLDEQKVSVTTIARRIGSARNWLTNGELARPPLVLFGLGQAAPAVLVSVAVRPSHVDAVIACGPSPDRAGIAMEHVNVPVLLIAHSGAFSDVDANRRTLATIHGEQNLAVLHEVHDPFENALEIGREVLTFLARESGHLRKIS
jgi:hypothetical protein